MISHESMPNSSTDQDAGLKTARFAYDSKAMPLGGAAVTPEAVKSPDTYSSVEVQSGAEDPEAAREAEKAVEVYHSWIEGYQRALDVVQETLIKDPALASQYSGKYKAIRAEVSAARGLNDFYELAHVIAGETGLSHQVFDLATEVDAVNEAYKAWSETAQSFASPNHTDDAEDTIEQKQDMPAETTQRALGSASIARTLHQSTEYKPLTYQKLAA